MKKLKFIGSAQNDLKSFPIDARRKAGFELFAVQRGLEPTDWKAMNSIGAGVREIRIRQQGAWRVIYVAKFEDSVYVLHAFQKKSQKTSSADLALAKKRYQQVRSNQ